MATDTAADLIGMDNEMRSMVLDTIRQLRKKLLTKDLILEWDKNEIFPEAAIREMLGPDIGLQLVFIPEEYGGLGGGARDSCALTRETSRICLGISTAFFALHLGSDPILVGATDEQKAKWLVKIAEGESIVAYAVTEPGAGSNLAALKTKAEPITDDDGRIVSYQLNGTKQFISNGGYADIVTVLANTPEGPAFFVVEKGTTGFQPGKSEEKHGIRASNTAPIVLDDVVVPAENLIGRESGNGMKQANEVFGYTRLMVAAMALGAAEEALDIAIKYAQERVQFGSTLSEKQGYSHKLIVPNVVRLMAAAAHIDQTAMKFDRGTTGLQEEGSIAKYFTTEMANIAADHSVQALGGYGYINEYEVEKIRRDVRITNIYEGTSEVQQNIISMFRWKKTVKTKGRFYENLACELDQIANDYPELKASIGANTLRIVNAVIQLIHAKKLSRSQHVMFALSEMIAWAEVNGAMITRAASDLKTGKHSAGKSRLAARIMAAETTRIIMARAAEIILGSEVMTTAEYLAFRQENNFNNLDEADTGLIADMDSLADIIFDRN